MAACLLWSSDGHFSRPGQKDFTDAAIGIGERLEIKTEMRDGSSAIGGLIERQIKFVSQ